jgi:hypothetical protein
VAVVLRFVSRMRLESTRCLLCGFLLFVGVVACGAAERILLLDSNPLSTNAADEEASGEHRLLSSVHDCMALLFLQYASIEVSMLLTPPSCVLDASADSDADDSDADEPAVWDLAAPVVTPTPHTFFARRLIVSITLPRAAVVHRAEVHTLQEELPL